MKNTNLMILSSIFFLSTSAFGTAAKAATIVRIPVFIEGDVKPIPAAEVNELLKATAAKPIPLFIEISDKQKKAYKLFEALDKKIAASLKTLGGDWEDLGRASEDVPGRNNTKDLFTCYTGDGNLVADLVSQLSDLAYSDQFSVIGTKYKDSTVVTYPDDSISALDESKLWKKWKGDDESVLILSAVTDSGDDVNESLIPVCAP